MSDTLESLRAEWERFKTTHNVVDAWDIVERLFAALENYDDSLSYFQDMAKREKEAAEAIKREEKWPENAWPAPAERSWMLAAQSEIARLKAALEAAFRRIADELTTSEREVAMEGAIGDLQAQVAKLREALMIFGRHYRDCSFRPAEYDHVGTEQVHEIPCDCGLRQALKETEP